MTHEILPGSLSAHGAVSLEPCGDTLHFTAARRIPSEFEREHLRVRDLAELPGRYRLPFRVEFSVRIDEPGFYLLVGEGHISFGTPWSDNRRLDDIVEPRRNTFFFHNHIPMDRYTEIAVTFDRRVLQVLVAGEERYFSAKERYMKSGETAARNAASFAIALACDKGVHASVRGIKVTEYEESAPIERGRLAGREAIKGNEASLPGEKTGCPTRCAGRSWGLTPISGA